MVRTARFTASALAAALALAGAAARAQDAAPLPVESAAAEDDRVWEDLSYGTGEADFTAIASDPDDPRRLYAGAAGSVFASDDGGATWVRILSVRGSVGQGVEGAGERRREARRADSLEDRLAEAREELIEEYKQEITEDLVSELGDFGETLADELAEELAEQRVAQEEERLAAEVREEMSRRGGDLTEAQRTEEEEAAEVRVERGDPRRIHRIDALPGGRVLVSAGSALFVSADRGREFAELPPGLLPPDHDVRAAAIDPRNAAVLYAATAGGLYVSRDAGEIWVRGGGIPDKLVVLDVELDPGNPDRVFAATADGLYLSTDSGTAFEPVFRPPDDLAREVRAVAVDPVDPRVVFAGTAQGMFRSLDSGVAWERLEPPGLHSQDITDLASLAWGLVVATRNGVFLSPDAGASFRELFAGLDERDVRRVAGTPMPLDLHIATGRGVFAYRQPEARARRLRTLAAIRDALSREPDPGDVMRRALQVARCDVDPDAWRSRARLAPLAPRLVLAWSARNPLFDHARQSLNHAKLPTEVTEYLYGYGGWQVMATWDVWRLFGLPGEVEGSRAFRHVERVRRRVLKRVASTYVTRRRLLVSLLQAPPADARSFALKQLELLELTAVLDSLTDGYYSTKLAEAGVAPDAVPGAKDSGRTP